MALKQEVEREMINYVGMPRLYLETADRRLFTHPFGPPISPYEEAVGKISQSYGESETKAAFAKSIIPNIFDSEIGEIVPFDVFSQFGHEDGIILTTKINYSRPYEQFPDLKNRNGQWLILILYPESASRPKISQVK